MFLKNTWHMAAWAEQVAPGQLVARTILDEPVVVFRTADGVAVAMEDRCPHRFAPLSAGRVMGDRVVCGYHGLEFDRSGACVHNPHGSGKIPGAARARVYALVEKHAVLWVWMGEQAADPALIPDFGVLDDTGGPSMIRRDSMVMDAPYELIVDNLLDCSHVCFLHEGILGNAQMVPVRTTLTQQGDSFTVSRFMPDIPIPRMFALWYQRDQVQVDTWTDITWHAPACMLLETGVTEPGRPRQEGTGMTSVHILTPETRTTANYFFSGRRWGLRPGTETDDMREKISNLRRFAFEKQDEPMIRAQHRILQKTPATTKPVMLETDVGVVRWRRTMEKLMAQEAQAAAPVRMAG